MAYRESSLDRNNQKWFTSDTSRRSLLQIRITRGDIRGLQDIALEFRYPISAIAGKNGSGKSTILALAACAYHYNKEDVPLLGRKYPYYTFSDFFVQAMGEIPPEGVVIQYQFLHNQWHLSARRQTKEGLGWQKMEKRQGGRWSNYSERIDRPVVFLDVCFVNTLPVAWPGSGLTS